MWLWQWYVVMPAGCTWWWLLKEVVGNLQESLPLTGLLAQLHDRPVTPMCVFSADEQQYKYVNVVMVNPPLLVGSPSP